MNNLFQMLSNAADGAFVIDENQQIVYWNHAAQEILGYTVDEVIGRTCFEILDGLDTEGCVICRHHCSVITITLMGEAVSNYDISAYTKSGELCWLNISILTATSDDGTPLIIHLFRDATQKKQSEQFIRHVLDAAERLQDQPPPVAENPDSSGTFINDLTDREREILLLLVHGRSTHDIAQALSISASTTRNHIQNIFHKLHVHSRVEAVAYAIEHGLTV